MNNEQYLVVVSGPSGSGKDTVVSRLMAQHPEIEISVSAMPAFEQKIADGEILEYTQYCGNYYGTPKSEVDRRIAAHTTVIMVIEVVGATNIKRLYPGATTIFIQPPSYAELEERLRGRGTESEQAIQSRLARAAEEMSYATDYDEVVVNDDVDRCADEIYRLIREHQHT